MYNLREPSLEALVLPDLDLGIHGDGQEEGEGEVWEGVGVQQPGHRHLYFTVLHCTELYCTVLYSTTSCLARTGTSATWLASPSRPPPGHQPGPFQNVPQKSHQLSMDVAFFQSLL